MLATLGKRVDSLDKQIRQPLDADDDSKHPDGLPQGLPRSVPGVGPVFSATLAAELRELGQAQPGRPPGRSAP